MELYLQFGYGMMGHCRSLISQWDGGTVIMSPRDLNASQLGKLSDSIAELPNGSTLFDPQFYLPHADHYRLSSHDYWPQNYETGAFWQGPALTNLLTKLSELNIQLGCKEFILPGLLATTIDDDWLETQRAIIEEAQSLDQDLPLISTIALSDDAVRNQEQIALLLEESENWNSYGYYLVFEHPRGQYFVDDPNWLVNLLDVVAYLKLQKAKVIIGYCNQQMLICSTVKADAISSGTWMNVRSFPPEKFRDVNEDEIKQRSKWYYCPQALSEYKIPSLDLAYRNKLLRDMAPPPELDCGYISNLFNGIQPTTIKPSEQSMFRHYLHCLILQRHFFTDNQDEFMYHGFSKGE